MSFLPLSDKINNQLILDSYDVIRNEYLSLIDQDFCDFTYVNEILNSPKRTGYFWQMCMLVWDKKFVETLPTAAGFSVLLPNSEIEPHGDYDDVYITGGDIPKSFEHRDTGLIKYHFVLDAPQNCGVIVENEEKIIKNGDLYSFDEGRTHSAYNRSNSKRGVLIMSFMKKDLWDLN